VYNLENQLDYVAGKSQWAVPDLATGPCGPLNLPVGFTIYSGNYSMVQVLNAKPSSLTLYQPGVYNCPAIFFVGGYQFQPDSDVATVYSGGADNQTSQPIFTEPMVGSGSSSGSWTGRWSILGSGSRFQNFQPGVYTVVGGDEWGDIALLYFTVT
jgi:hypothetical protein